ncbi:Uncharacterised protein [uncultured archaeon]|nr:Uncharacterised protein [uncultured archaeon]
MCTYIDSEYIAPGYKCCHCGVYNGMQQVECRECRTAPCETIGPDIRTGKTFNTRIYHFPSLYDMRQQDDKREDTYAKTIALLTTFTKGFQRGDRFYDASGNELRSVLDILQTLQSEGEINIKTASQG